MILPRTRQKLKKNLRAIEKELLAKLAEFDEMEDSTGMNIVEDLNQDIKVTSDNMANIKADQMERAGRAIEEAVGDTDRLTSGFKELNGGAQQAAESMYSMTHQLEQLKNTTQ